MDDLELDEKKVQAILKEQNFPYVNMTVEERDFCLKLLGKCKDIEDSENKVNCVGKGEILQTSFRRDGDRIHANGCFTIGGNVNYEGRWLDADIYLGKDNIIVDMLIERLGKVDGLKQYRVLDVFERENDKLVRKSYYNHGGGSFLDIIEDEEMKGKIK